MLEQFLLILLCFLLCAFFSRLLSRISPPSSSFFIRLDRIWAPFTENGQPFLCVSDAHLTLFVYSTAPFVEIIKKKSIIWALTSWQWQVGRLVLLTTASATRASNTAPNRRSKDTNFHFSFFASAETCAFTFISNAAAETAENRSLKLYSILFAFYAICAPFFHSHLPRSRSSTLSLFLA